MAIYHNCCVKNVIVIIVMHVKIFDIHDLILCSESVIEVWVYLLM